MTYIPNIAFCMICQFDSYFKIVGSLTILRNDLTKKAYLETYYKQLKGKFFEF